MKILVINAGSSTFKVSIYQIDDPHSANRIWKGTFDWGKNLKNAFLSVSKTLGNKFEQYVEVTRVEEGLKLLIEQASSGATKVLDSPNDIQVVGHRVVHGGEIIHPTLITPEVKETIKSLIPLAPLHNPHNLKGIELAETFFPSIPQIAIFDTAFHHTIPQFASTYAGPFDWREQGIKRYGFHGISHQYCYDRCSQILKKDLSNLKVISCHIGNGASLAAIQNGQSVDTTMGLTPIEGLMMGSRCGSIDPGILLYLLNEKKMAPEQLFRMLNYESGLKGISGTSEDMREIIRLKAEGNERAQLAWEMYLHSVKRNLGAMIGALNGLDLLIFAGGIGENSPEFRNEACSGISFLGLSLDQEKNKVSHSDQIISTANSRVLVMKINTKEDSFIALECFKKMT